MLFVTLYIANSHQYFQHLAGISAYRDFWVDRSPRLIYDQPCCLSTSRASRAGRDTEGRSLEMLSWTFCATLVVTDSCSKRSSGPSTSQSSGGESTVRMHCDESTEGGVPASSWLLEV